MMNDYLVLSIGHQTYALPYQDAKQRRFVAELLWFAENAKLVGVNTTDGGYMVRDRRSGDLDIALYPAARVSESVVAEEQEAAVKAGIRAD